MPKTYQIAADLKNAAEVGPVLFTTKDGEELVIMKSDDYALMLDEKQTSTQVELTEGFWE